MKQRARNKGKAHTTASPVKLPRTPSSQNGDIRHVDNRNAAGTSNGHANESISMINARPILENAEERRRREKLNAGPTYFLGRFLHSTVPAWINTIVMLSLIFGGCCSNVFALETIIKDEPDTGYLVTFAQFLLVAAEGFYHHLDTSSWTLLKPNKVPIFRWMGVVVLFFSISVLNNLVFKYHISVPLHIIVRSGGSVLTMLIGFIFGKRYSKVQVLSVLVLSTGIIFACMGNAKQMKDDSEESLPRFITGLSILFGSQVMAALMGLYVESTYQKYGNHWREGLFMSHALSLPIFAVFAPAIRDQFLRLYNTKATPIKELFPLLPDNHMLADVLVPRAIFFLCFNAVTQYLCVRGVNSLTGVSSALTVTIVLNIRKLVSLLLSIWIFGNKLRPAVMTGAAVVFLGAFVYGLESQRLSKLRKQQGHVRRPTPTPEPQKVPSPSPPAASKEVK